ncbi:NAD(P)-binding domain-containing protein [Actinomycetospora sp. NBRC 106378]|uniref:NADPH-dependent F420 reductase n=1 Tax=Actinomycetospora sp. NBRC 106378 TaxID=3032208 RepID=UPI0024A328C0|nr:NAD(P)-binding domain-containing protein [Actinomycetospora sp. NBRC 106378]GLZ50640.1 dinucleotide-binding protein [Actinomycetospora sp. NBRC 106378]
MTSVSVIGTGKMAAAITEVFIRSKASVQVLGRSPDPGGPIEQLDVEHAVIGDDLTGDVVVLAVPYEAFGDVIARCGDQLDGKVVVDISNPIDFSTFDELVVPTGSSAAAELSQQIPTARVVKAFNTTFGHTLVHGTVDGTPTTVLLAGDDVDAKVALMEVVEAAGMRAVDVGLLPRAKDLESTGFLQITLAALAQTSFDSGFALSPFDTDAARRARTEVVPD